MAVRSRIRQGTEESRQRSLLITPIEPVSELGRLNLEHSHTMPSSEVKDQAHKLLRTLCNCLLPVIQGTSGKTIDAKEIDFGIEADEFASELEKFISGMIFRSQPRRQDIAIEASLKKKKLEEGRVDYGVQSVQKLKRNLFSLAQSIFLTFLTFRTI
ncbi:hypothetical protein BJ912DRAFT_1045044 [Pholiota molesta]|nr:hypothetical protein BJ912DRAFT_1045044 [Pholiota molesta]